MEREAMPTRMRMIDGWLKKMKRAEGRVVGTAKSADGKRRVASSEDS